MLFSDFFRRLRAARGMRVSGSVLCLYNTRTMLMPMPRHETREKRYHMSMRVTSSLRCGALMRDRITPPEMPLVTRDVVDAPTRYAQSST